MSFWINLEYGTRGSRFTLPQELLVDALPPEGTIIGLTYKEEDAPDFPFEVEVEDVFVDATAPPSTRYKAFVIPA